MKTITKYYLSLKVWYNWFALIFVIAATYKTIEYWDMNTVWTNLAVLSIPYSALVLMLHMTNLLHRRTNRKR